MSTSTINYETALSLKNAGFPQGTSTFIFPSDADVSGTAGYTGKSCYVPSLSELIEACEDRFDCIHKWRIGHIDNVVWEARWGDENSEHYWCKGTTPEEAMCALYISLHKK